MVVAVRSFGRVAGLAGLLALVTAAGCRSLPRRAKDEAKPAAATAAAATSEPGVIRTDFQAEVPTATEFNLHLDLGRAHEAQGRFEAAEAEYLKAIDLAERPGRHRGAKPTAKQQAEAHRKLAGALDRQGHFAQAEAHYRTALKLAPNEPKIWNDAGYSYYLQGRMADAIRSLKTAAKLAPSDPRIATNLGLALAADNQIDAALEALTKAGGPAVAHANLAYLLAASGRAEEARAHYRKALELMPSLEPARAALAKLDADSQQSQAAASVAARGPSPSPGPVPDSGIIRTEAVPPGR
ncbi:MAG: tetratricopeptide repeat protein [Isosphaeraceae bacterium]|nr:tetratricopeptide repeat protein [Isosphaeraceae bacterium]